MIVLALLVADFAELLRKYWLSSIEVYLFYLWFSIRNL